MKKYFGLILCTFIAFLLVGCASLPETVEEGKGLLIGNVEYIADDANAYVKGKKTQVEVTIKDVNSDKTYFARTNNNSYFEIFLPATSTYTITKVYKREENGAAMWVNLTNFNTFTVNEKEVTNIGKWVFRFNGTTNRVYWERTNYQDTLDNFNKKKIKAEESGKTVSEWYNVTISEK